MDRSEWVRKLRDAVDYGEGDFEPDNPPCPECGAIMEFSSSDDYGDLPSGEAYWECLSCGYRFKEVELDPESVKLAP